MIVTLKAKASRTRKQQQVIADEDIVKRRRFENLTWFPTEEEIDEGKAFLRWLMEPDDDCLRDAHTRAWNRMMSNQKGDVALLRCSRCHTLKYGRKKNDPCGVCGAKAGYYEHGEN